MKTHIQKYIDILNKIDIENLKEIKITDDIIHAVEWVLESLDNGIIKIVEKDNNGRWFTNIWIKLAIYLSFKIKKIEFMNNPIGFDKFPSKFIGWGEKDFIDRKIRLVPGALVRQSAFIDESCIIMPSFINVGAHIGKGSMIDTWSTIGSCAYIGDHVHISGGVGIGGVLEPIQSSPVIIENNCFIGARSEICEGVIVGEGSVISMGCYIGQSTRIINRDTNEVIYGKIPSYSVVVPGNYRYNDNLSGYCVVIIKQVDEKTRKKTSINDLLRE